MRSRDALFPPEPNIEACLTDLAVNGTVAAATQHQAMNALACLDKRVLTHGMPGRIEAGRADKKCNVSVVMTREEVASVISLLDGTTQLVAMNYTYILPQGGQGVPSPLDISAFDCLAWSAQPRHADVPMTEVVFVEFVENVLDRRHEGFCQSIADAFGLPEAEATPH